MAGLRRRDVAGCVSRGLRLGASDSVSARDANVARAGVSGNLVRISWTRDRFQDPLELVLRARVHRSGVFIGNDAWKARPGSAAPTRAIWTNIHYHLVPASLRGGNGGRLCSVRLRLADLQARRCDANLWPRSESSCLAPYYGDFCPGVLVDAPQCGPSGQTLVHLAWFVALYSTRSGAGYCGRRLLAINLELAKRCAAVATGYFDDARGVCRICGNYLALRDTLSHHHC